MSLETRAIALVTNKTLETPLVDPAGASARTFARNVLQSLRTNVQADLAKTRYETLDGKQYLVVPMVMITVGVHNGSAGPLHYPSEELSKTPEVWDHKPVVVYHPTINGVGVSACKPEVLATYAIGLIMNTTFEPIELVGPTGERVRGGRLRAEAWIDPVKADKVDPRVLESVKNGKMIEVSTGLFTDNEGQTGVWNGEGFMAVARNYRADHLAILPDQVGSCSLAKGAGLLRNEARAEMPQVADLDALYEHLRSKGVPVAREEVSAKTLKPYQSDLNKAKVDRIKEKGLGEIKKKELLVSDEDEVLDGHHRHAAALELDPEAKLPVLRVKQKTRDAIESVKGFSGVTYKGIRDGKVQNDAWSDVPGEPRGKQAQESQAGGLGESDTMTRPDTGKAVALQHVEALTKAHEGTSVDADMGGTHVYLPGEDHRSVRGTLRERGFAPSARSRSVGTSRVQSMTHKDGTTVELTSVPGWGTGSVGKGVHARFPHRAESVVTGGQTGEDADAVDARAKSVSSSTGTAKLLGPPPTENKWSDEARAAAVEARKAHAKGLQEHVGGASSVEHGDSASNVRAPLHATNSDIVGKHLESRGFKKDQFGDYEHATDKTRASIKTSGDKVRVSFKNARAPKSEPGAPKGPKASKERAPKTAHGRSESFRGFSRATQGIAHKVEHEFDKKGPTKNAWSDAAREAAKQKKHFGVHPWNGEGVYHEKDAKKVFKIESAAQKHADKLNAEEGAPERGYVVRSHTQPLGNQEDDAMGDFSEEEVRNAAIDALDDRYGRASSALVVEVVHPDFFAFSTNGRRMVQRFSLARNGEVEFQGTPASIVRELRYADEKGTVVGNAYLDEGDEVHCVGTHTANVSGFYGVGGPQDATEDRVEDYDREEKEDLHDFEKMARQIKRVPNNVSKKTAGPAVPEQVEQVAGKPGTADAKHQPDEVSGSKDPRYLPEDPNSDAQKKPTGNAKDAKGHGSSAREAHAKGVAEKSGARHDPGVGGHIEKVRGDKGPMVKALTDRGFSKVHDPEGEKKYGTETYKHSDGTTADLHKGDPGKNGTPTGKHLAVFNAWSPEARKAAIEARKGHSKSVSETFGGKKNFEDEAFTTHMGIKTDANVASHLESRGFTSKGTDHDGKQHFEHTDGTLAAVTRSKRNGSTVDFQTHPKAFAGSVKNTKNQGESSSDEPEAPTGNQKEVAMFDKAKAIAAIVGNTGGAFGESDRPALELMSQGQLELILRNKELDVGEGKNPAEGADDDEGRDTGVGASGKKDKAQKKDKVTNGKKPKDSDDDADDEAPTKNSLEDVLENASPEVREVVQEALVQRNQARATLIKSITSNAQAGYTAEELQAKPTAELRKLARLATNGSPAANRRPAVYFGQGMDASEVTANAASVEALPPPKMDFTSK